ncbi:MAG: hypothetical protein ACI9HK_003910 [Pirellulaceae bacterium]|jgi:hypothetical protein
MLPPFRTALGPAGALGLTIYRLPKCEQRSWTIPPELGRRLGLRGATALKNQHQYSRNARERPHVLGIQYLQQLRSRSKATQLGRWEVAHVA